MASSTRAARSTVAACRLGLRAAGCRAEGEPEAPVVALHGHLARGRRRHRLVGDPGLRGLGGLRPRRDLHRPAHRVHLLPQALPRGPPRRGLRGEARQGPRERPRRPQLPQLRQQGHLHRAQELLRPALHPPRPHPGRPARSPTCARRPPRASSPTSARSSRPPARSRRSASRRSASPSATRSRPATSSSAPASSSRWRWSSSSSPARTSSGRNTGWSSAGTGTPAWACVKRTCAGTSTRREALALLQAHRRHRVPLQLRRQRVGRARRRRQPHRLRPHHALQGLRPRPLLLRPGSRRALDAVRHRARGRCRPRMLAFLLDAYSEDEAPNAKGVMEKRAVMRLDPRLAPGQGRRPAAVPQRRPLAEGPRPRGRTCARTGTSSSTTPAPSAAATVARTRSAPRSASPSTSTPSTTTR